MNTFQEKNDVSEDLEDSFCTSVEQGQQSTLWIGNTGETPITGIKIHETKTIFLLNVYIADVHLIKNLMLKITPETVLIQGQPADAMVVEGYFSPGGFQSLIPLPHPVQPESTRTHIQPDGFSMQLAKDFRFKRFQVLMKLPIANLNQS